MLYAQKYMIYFIANNFVNLPTVPSCIVNPNKPKIDCGWLGIDQQTCEKRTCCWAQADPGTPWCYVKEFGSEYGPGEYSQGEILVGGVPLGSLNRDPISDIRMTGWLRIQLSS